MSPARKRSVRDLGSWALAVLLLAAGGVVVATTLPSDAGEEPFAVHVALGERGVGRNIDVTVQDVRFVHALSEPPSPYTALPTTPWTATGNWLVVDLDAAAVRTQQAAWLNGVLLETDGRTFQASERPESLYRTPLVPGVPRRGSVAFELPDGLRPGPATLAFSISADPRSDSQIRVAIDLADVPVQEIGALLRVEWTR